MQFETYTQTTETIWQRIEATKLALATHPDLKSTWPLIFSCLDLTTLEGTDNTKRIDELCAKALDYSRTSPGTAVAAVCLYIPFVSQAKKLLKDSGIKVATVACAFPSGQLPLALKLEEVKYAVEAGADEIDMVISRGKMIEGDHDGIFEEISAVKAACGHAHLKVILETGELASVSLIRKASELACLAGADFLKTSTGKVNPAATPEAAIVMLDTIAEFYGKTGKRIGFKPAGGIAEPTDALLYAMLVKEIAGDEWFNNKLFRIGASRLAEKLKYCIAG